MRTGKVIIFFLTVFILTSAESYGIEKAERISDREIIEKLTRLEQGQEAINKRFDDVNKRFDELRDDVNRRFDDVNRRISDIMSLLQILIGVIIVVGGGILGWLIVIWKKLIKVEERQRQFETQDDEIKFLKEAYNKVNGMVLKLMDVLNRPNGVL